METVVKHDDIKIINSDTISIDGENLERAKELFDNCKYNEAEQLFSRIKGSEASAWRILCYIMTGDIGRKGGKIASLLQESIKNKNADIYESFALLKILIDRYGGSIDRRTKHKAISSLYDTFNYSIRERMVTSIVDVNKKALDIVKQKGYIPSILNDKAIPMKVLNNRMMKYKCKMKHYKIDEIMDALKTINNDSFIQDVVNGYLNMAQFNITDPDKFNHRLDTRNQDVLKYIKSLYLSNLAYEKELRLVRNMDRLQLVAILNKLNQQGWLCITMMSEENTKNFNMANDEEKIMCDIELERINAASVATSLEYDDLTERRGYLIRDNIINQISKEDIALGDVTDPFTHEFISPVYGTIYCDD